MPQQQNNIKTLPQPEPTVGTTLNVPRDTWRRLRSFVTDKGGTQQGVWLQALTEFLDRNAPLKGNRRA